MNKLFIASMLAIGLITAPVNAFCGHGCPFDKPKTPCKSEKPCSMSKNIENPCEKSKPCKLKDMEKVKKHHSGAKK